MRAACRCASPGGWIAMAASRSASDEFTRPDRPAHHGGFRPAMARDRRDLWVRSHRPGDAGLCDGRDLERHHAELAGGRRRHLARRTVRPADLRCGAKLHRLSRLRRLPRFRRHRAARRPRRAELSGEMAAPQEPSAAPSAEPASVASPSSDELPEPIAARTPLQRFLLQASHQNDLETPVEPPKEAVRGKRPRKTSRKACKTAFRTSPGTR